MNDDGSGDRLAATAGERLRAWVRGDFDVDLTSIDGVGHGAGEAAELWRGLSVDRAPYAVRHSRTRPAGMIVSAHLAAHGVPGVVGPMSSPLRAAVERT